MIEFIPIVKKFDEPIGINIWYSQQDQDCIIRCNSFNEYYKIHPCKHGEASNIKIKHKLIYDFPYFEVMECCCDEIREHFEDFTNDTKQRIKELGLELI